MSKLLAIDDDPDVLDMVRDYFSARGFDVLTAQTAKEGLVAASFEKPQIVLLDLKLPDESGEYVLKHLKEKFPAVPVIIVTGCEIEKIKDRLFKLGCDAIFQKGVSIIRIQQEIFDLLNSNNSAKSIKRIFR